MAHRIGPGYFYDIVSVAKPHLTADGSRLAFVRSTADRETGDTPSQIMVADLPLGEPQPFTNGPKDDHPRWSPDGSRLGFLRKDDRDKAQLWVISSSMGEALKLTDQGSGITDFWWSPDGSRIAYQANVDPRDEDPGAAPGPIVITHLRYKQDGIGLRDQARAHLFVVDADGGESSQITIGDFDSYGAVWSPDGGQLAFISARHELRDIESRTEAYVTENGTGSPQSEGERPLALWSDGLYAVSAVTWSPDGGKLAVIGAPATDTLDGCPMGCQSWIYVLERGQPPRRITDGSVTPQSSGNTPWSGGGLQWGSNDEIVFQGDSRGRSYVCAAAAGGNGVRRLTSGSAQITGWTSDAAARTAVAASTDSDSTGDIVEFDLSSREERRLTDYNREWAASHPPAQVERFTFERKGMEIEARLLHPPDFDSSKKYPLLLDVHGGPHSVFYDAFYALHQIPASAGYVVLAMNPRGSGTYGQEFAAAVHGDWGGEPYEDLMRGVDLVMERPYIDRNRMVMHGSSYGGYMGSWIAGHTDRFKAIAIAAPVTNLPSFYGTSDIGVFFSEAQLGANRWDDETGASLRGIDEYVRHSPLTYARNVKTPVLIVHGEEDDRVPIEQGEQFFVALKRLGREVEFVRLPGSHHGLMRNDNLRLRQDYYERILDWFERHLPG